MSLPEIQAAVGALDGSTISSRAEVKICFGRYSPLTSWSIILHGTVMAQHRSFMTAFHTRGVVSLYDFSCEALHTRTYLPSSTPTTLRARSVIFTSRQDFCRIPGVDPGSVLEVTSPDSWEKVLPSRLTGSLGRLGRDVTAPLSQVRQHRELRTSGSVAAFKMRLGGIRAEEMLFKGHAGA